MTRRFRVEYYKPIERNGFYASSYKLLDNPCSLEIFVNQLTSEGYEVEIFDNLKNPIYIPERAYCYTE